MSLEEDQTYEKLDCDVQFGLPTIGSFHCDCKHM